MAKEGAERMLNLLLADLADDGYWAAVIRLMREYCSCELGLALPMRFHCDAFRLETDEVSRYLIETLGEERTLPLVSSIVKCVRKMKDDEMFRLRLASASMLSSETEKPQDDNPKPNHTAVSESPETPLQKGQASTRQIEQPEDTEERVHQQKQQQLEQIADKPSHIAVQVTVDASTEDSSSEESEFADATSHLLEYEQPAQPDRESSRSPPSNRGRDRADQREQTTERPTESATASASDRPQSPMENPQNITRVVDQSRHSDCDASDVDDRRDADVVLTERAGPHMLKSFERQAAIVMAALKEGLVGPAEPACVDTIQRQIERFVFNPDRRIPPEVAEVRYNFYPPFLTPKAICNYHIFAVTAPIPKSCKANRSGTELLRKTRETSYFRRLPKWRPLVEIDDELGSEVSPVGELRDDIKLVPLKDDVSRLQWAKMRGEHITFFSYPSLHMPPKISRMLMETLLQPFADEVKHEATEPPMAVSDDELRQIVDPLGRHSGQALASLMNTRRTMMSMAIRYCAELELMERVFREPSSVKKCQEVLHHTLHHGYVRVVRDTARVNLSNYVTFHGITYNNPLNNCVVPSLMEGMDREDFVVDTIFLFLVLTWQTAMGMWQQAITDETVLAYTAAFRHEKHRLYALTNVSEMSRAIVDILMDGDRLTNELRKALPNFTAQSQISSFRHFLMERSNIPIVAAPFMPSDLVPLSFKQCPPLLWSQTYLLQNAYFLMNHGGYMWEPNEEENPSMLQRAYCPCNLCSPHRMPCHNVALHNEMLAIGTFEIRSAEGKSFKLTPELWTNAYIDKFVPQDFHPFTVHHYQDHSSRFTSEITACVTQSPEIFSLIRQIQTAREEFLLTKGKGGYKDPQTGESLTESAPHHSHRTHPGPLEAQALPTLGADLTRGTSAASRDSPIVRDSADEQHRQHFEDGPANVRRACTPPGATRAPKSERPSAFAGRGRGGYRRRIPRKPGYLLPGERGFLHRDASGGGRGAGEYRDIIERDPVSTLPKSTTYNVSASQAPKKILTRAPSADHGQRHRPDPLSKESEETDEASSTSSSSSS
ncbi:hexon assembly-associated protein [Aviadenovirus bubonis]|nr:hexon assembly-associated protein [Owl adenovirus]